MPISRRIELLNWAVEHKSYIIEDDYDSEFRYQGKPIPALQGLDQNDRVIYMNTFTKSLAPSFRMSYMVLPVHLMPVFQRMSSYHGCTVPTFEQYVLYKFMQGGFFERHINRMRNDYREKLEMIRTLIKDVSWLKLHGDEAGLHFMLEIRKDLSAESTKALLEKHRIAAKVYAMDELNPIYNKTCILIGYSGIPKKEIVSHFDALVHALDKEK